MADDPRAVRLARRRMLLTSKPKPKITIPIGFRKRAGPRITKTGTPTPPRLRVRK